MNCEPSVMEHYTINKILESQLRECYGRVVYSHKTHEKCADILLTRLSRIKLLQIALSVTTTGSFIAILLGEDKLGTIVGTILSAMLLCLNAYTKDYDLGEIAQKHKQAGSDLWLIREQYLSLITDLHIGHKAMNEIQLERDSLLTSLHSVYVGAPSTTIRAYKDARNALQNNEEMTFSDQEIDSFLPVELRRIKAAIKE